MSTFSTACAGAVSNIPASLSELVERAATDFAHLEVFPDQFRLRGLEFQLLMEAAPIPRCRTILEIGCGFGLVLSFLAAYADTVVGVDLPDASPVTSSCGFGTPRALLQGLGVSNAHLVGGNAQALPLENECVEVVFSNYTLEHVPDPDLALREMHRVLATDGWLYLVLPTSMDRVTYLPAFYQQLIQAAQRCVNGAGAPACESDAHGPRVSSSSNETPSGSLWRRFWRRFPHFPFPSPHGAYAHFLQEAVLYHPWRWQRMVARNGFQITQVLTTIPMPYHLLGMVTKPFPWYQRWARWPDHLAWQRSRPARWFGHNVCLIARKVSA